MKIAIISDIHSNPTVLRTVLKDAEVHKCDRIVCLGDLVGYGYDPNTCIDIVRERKIECLLGNHDAGLISRLGLDWFNSFAGDAIRRQRPTISEDNKRWLATLPYNQKEGNYAFAHGVYVGGEDRFIRSPSEHFEYVLGYSDAALQFLGMSVSGGVRDIFVGHTHIANAYCQTREGHIEEFRVDIDDEYDINLSNYAMTIVNVGSVGYPRNQPYTIYGIFDTETSMFYHRILPFDFEDYIKNMKKNGAPIPRWIEDRQEEAKRRPVLFK